MWYCHVSKPRLFFYSRLVFISRWKTKKNHLSRGKSRGKSQDRYSTIDIISSLYHILTPRHEINKPQLWTITTTVVERPWAEAPAIMQSLMTNNWLGLVILQFFALLIGYLRFEPAINLSNASFAAAFIRYVFLDSTCTFRTISSWKLPSPTFYSLLVLKVSVFSMNGREIC